MICGRIVSTLGMALAAGLGQETEVREVRIATAGTDTEITVVVGGEVTARHLMIQDPPRLILDLEGAVLGLGRDRYEGIGRGGVIRMRSSQFQPDIVRIVFDLALDLEHEVATDPGAVRVTFPNRGPPFPPWSTAAETTEAETTAAETTEARAGPGE